MNLAALAAAQTIEVEAPALPGYRWRLRHLVAGDMLDEHVALLAIAMPPSEAERLTADAMRVASTEERADIAATVARESARAALDPDVRARAWAYNCAVVRASVIAAAEPGCDFEAIQIVAEREQEDAAAGRVWIGSLLVDVVVFLAGAARAHSFGGEVGRARLARFRRQRVPATARTDGPDVG